MIFLSTNSKNTVIHIQNITTKDSILLFLEFFIGDVSSLRHLILFKTCFFFFLSIQLIAIFGSLWKIFTTAQAQTFKQTLENFCVVETVDSIFQWLKCTQTLYLLSVLLFRIFSPLVIGDVFQKPLQKIYHKQNC